MATPTYDPIASTTLSSSASSVTFSSLDTIAAGYRDLVLVADVIATGTAYGNLRANNDTGSNYSIVYMRGDGSATQSGAYAISKFFDYPVFWSDKRTVFVTQIFDFSQTDKHKSALTRSSQSATATEATAGRWANTAAIHTLSFDFAGYGVNIAAGSTFSLYGIAA